MRYFLLKTDPKYNTSPVIENWYPKIDVRLIRKETGHKLPKRELLFIQSNPDTIFTDIIDFPFSLERRWSEMSLKCMSLQHNLRRLFYWIVKMRQAKFTTFPFRALRLPGTGK